jgi:DNA adenine methylase
MGNTRLEMKNVSPLRYPGGKTRAIKYLKEYIPKDCTEFYSVFCGGMSLELDISCNSNIEKVVVNDKFDILINFWKVAKNSNESLITKVNEIKSFFSKEFFMSFKKKLGNSIEKETLVEREVDLSVERAAMYFAINRSSFSGATFSGGFSKESMEKRFTKSSIERLSKVDLKKFEFHSMDFSEFLDTIPETRNCFIYLDPPYYIENSNLYGNNGDLHENFDHVGLFYAISKKKNVLWMMSYNDSDFIRDLYKDYTIKELNWSYSMNKSKKSSEIIIMNM